MADLAPNEHPRLPRLAATLIPARPDQHAPRGRTITGYPAHARVMFSPVGVLTTSDPDRIDAIAEELHELAAALRCVQAEPAVDADGQLVLGYVR